MRRDPPRPGAGVVVPGTDDEGSVGVVRGEVASAELVAPIPGDDVGRVLPESLSDGAEAFRRGELRRVQVGQLVPACADVEDDRPHGGHLCQEVVRPSGGEVVRLALSLGEPFRHGGPGCRVFGPSDRCL
jgi:hypothetical protein